MIQNDLNVGLKVIEKNNDQQTLNRFKEERTTKINNNKDTHTKHKYLRKDPS